MSRALEGLAIIAVYALLAVGLQHPLFADPARTVVDGGGWLTIPPVNVSMWVLAWGWHALTTAPLELFQANIFHPMSASLTSTEPMLGQLPLFGPVYAFSGNPVLANQMTLLFNTALCGAALFALLRHWGVPRAAAFFGGFVYAFCPIRADNVVHAKLLAGQYLPLALLFLDRTLSTARIGAAAGFALFLLLQLLCSYEYAYITTLALVGYGAGVVTVTRGRLPARSVVMAATAALVAAGVLGVISLPYAASGNAGVFVEQDLSQWLGRGAAGFWRNYLYPPVALSEWGWRLDRGLSIYVGLLPLACAVVALLPRPRRGSPPAAGAVWARPATVGLMLACYLMALGPDVHVGGGDIRVPSLYGGAMWLIPGLGSVPAPSRFGVGFMLGFSALAGLGLARLLRWDVRDRRLAVLGVVATVILTLGTAWEYGFLLDRYRMRTAPTGTAMPPVYAALAELPQGPVVELPMGNCSLNRYVIESTYVLQSTVHWHPLLNGQGDRTPRFYESIRALARALPDPRATALLARATGLRYVVVHLREVPLLKRGRWFAPKGLRFVQSFGSDVLYEVLDPPASDLEQMVTTAEPHQTTWLGTPLSTVAAAEHHGDVVLDASMPGAAVISLPFPVDVGVTNRSTTTWPALARAGGVMLAYRWENDRGETVSENLVAAPLPYDLAGGESLRASLCVAPPSTPGDWRLVLGLAQDGEWFADATARVELRLVPPDRATDWTVVFGGAAR
jgi:hypothetical protein